MLVLERNVTSKTTPGVLILGVDWGWEELGEDRQMIGEQ